MAPDDIKQLRIYVKAGLSILAKAQEILDKEPPNKTKPKRKTKAEQDAEADAEFLERVLNGHLKSPTKKNNNKK